jgi:hypothetical protein
MYPMHGEGAVQGLGFCAGGVGDGMLEAAELVIPWKAMH